MHKILHMIKFFVLMALAGGLAYIATDPWARYLFATVGIFSAFFIVAEAAGYGELRTK